VPVVCYCLLQNGYRRYQQEAQQQRANCEARADWLHRYADQQLQLANGIYAIDDVDQRLSWERQWHDLIHHRDQERLSFGDEELLHYPTADRLLVELENSLNEQQHEIEEALRKRDNYNKLGNGLSDLAQEIERIRSQAYYYQRIGADGVYLYMMEGLARLEADYDRRRRERNRRTSEVTNHLDRADRIQRDIRRELGDFADLLLVDEQITYHEHLQARLEDFSLRTELERLVTGAP